MDGIFSVARALQPSESVFLLSQLCVCAVLMQPVAAQKLW